MRQAKDNAQKTFNQSQTLADQSTGNANELFNTLQPAFSQEAVNPQGYTPSQKAKMDTASQQSTGGGTAAAVGQADLMGARDRNAGSFAPAIDAASRHASMINSGNALGVEGKDADLMQKKQREGLSGLNSLYGINSGNALKSLGIENQSTDTMLNADKQGWLQNSEGIINTINQSASGASGLGWKPFAA